MKKIIIPLLLLIIIGGIFIGKPYYELHFSTLKMTNNREVIIYVSTGSDINDLASLLNTAKVIDSDSFKSFADKLDFTDDKVEPGKYRIKNGMKIKNLIYALKNGNQEIKDVRITFNNCQNVNDMAGKVAPNIETDSTTLVNYILSPQTLEKYGFTESTITSLFLPDTYEVGEWDMTAEKFVDRMAQEYRNFWTAERKEKASARNLTQSEVTTLGSIIEAEQSRIVSEWPAIAGLYLNRLKKGMLLQSDPTAKFCWGDELDGVQRLLTIHMQRDCPYNTYLYTGLPPGPIRMTSKKALNAVLDADDNNYLYMCAKPDNSGLHNFAASYNQHLANARKFQAFMRQQGY